LFQAHACCSSGSLLRSQQTPWYEAFAEKGLDGAVESGEHCAKVVLSDPEMLHNAKMNFSGRVLEYNEYWAGGSGAEIPMLSLDLTYFAIFSVSKITIVGK